MENLSYESKLDRSRAQDRNPIESSSPTPEQVRITTPECATKGCGQVFITLHLVESLGCVCHSTEKQFRQRFTSFERSYGLHTISPSRSCVVEYNGADKCCCKQDRAAERAILHPGDTESAIHDRLMISNIFNTLVERANSTERQHIYLSLGAEHVGRTYEHLPKGGPVLENQTHQGC